MEFEFEYEPFFEMTVPGIPEQRGSKTGRPQLRLRRNGEGCPNCVTPKRPGKRQMITIAKNGVPIINMADSNKRSGAWIKQIHDFARRLYRGDPVDGTVCAEISFFMPRIKGHFGTGRNADKLKPGSPVIHEKFPDIDKLIRGILDGLSGIIYTDDKLVAEVHARKVYVAPGNAPRAHISVSHFRIKEIDSGESEAQGILWEGQD